MKFFDQTINQHYLSQVEQRLNTFNPNASHRNQKIYCFEILKRGNSDEIQLGAPQEKRIEKNLSLDDLFTFDVVPNANLRLNLEILFQQYEKKVHVCTESILRKIETKSEDITDDLIALFSVKLLNFIRNPYSIPKFLDTFKGIGNFRPTDPLYNAFFQAVLNGRKPHQHARCKELNISDEQYLDWLGTLFMLLSPLLPSQKSMFDQVISKIFLNKNSCVGVLVSTYSKEKCLLSDRSFCTSSQENQIESMDFNLRDSAFIAYFFGERITFFPKDTHPELLELSETLPNVNVVLAKDNISLLRCFNARVINQSDRRVFCATKENILF